jgi:hypothetical protein
MDNIAVEKRDWSALKGQALLDALNEISLRNFGVTISEGRS